MWIQSFLLLASAADFETGVVAASDGAAFYRNTIPQVARLGDGRLMTVTGVSPKSVPPTSRICAVFSSDGGRTWDKPRVLYEEKQKDRFAGDPNILVDGNTVFVYWTHVFYPNTIRKSWTWGIRSTDNGATWSEPREIVIPRQYTPGKQHNGIKLADGAYAMGISWDHWPEMGFNARTEGEMNLSSGLLRSRDGWNWTLHGDLHVFVEKVTPGSTNGLAEPSIVQLDNGEIFMLLRSGASNHYEARSRDGGVTWTKPRPSSLVGHNTPTALWKLENGRNDIVAVWNNSPMNRFPLTAALSSDGGRSWSPPRILATTNGPQISYPGVTQATDGTIVAVWQAHRDDGGRDIRYARFTREWLLKGPQVVAFGDSLTAPRAGVVTYSDVLRAELPRRGIAAGVINRGVGGNTTEAARARFERDVLDQRPDAVILQLGTNDSAVDVWKQPPATGPRVELAAYRANIEYFVDQLRTRRIPLVLMTPNRMAWTDKLRGLYGKPPYDPSSDAGFNVLLDRYARTLRDIANRQRIPLVDAARIVPASAVLDGMHPSSEGHALLAAQLANEIETIWRSR